MVLALYAFAVFGWELVVTLVLDPLLAPFGTTGSALAHWSITAAGWLTGVAVILRSTRDLTGGLDRLFTEPLRGNRVLRVLGVAVAVFLAVGGRAVFLREWKLVGEYQGLSLDQGDAAPFAFVVLLLYYLCEAAVIVLTLALGQRAGEMRFGTPAVPWGGFVLALTWGAVHILLQGPAAGVYAMAAAVLYGCICAWGPRRALSTYLIVTATFIV